MVRSTDRSKTVVPVLVLLLVALWFILRGDLLYVFPCDILFLCFSVLLVLRLPRLGWILVIFVVFTIIVENFRSSVIHHSWSCQFKKLYSVHHYLHQFLQPLYVGGINVISC